MRDRIEERLGAWGRFVYQRSSAVLLAVSLVVAIFVSQLARLEIDTSTEGFLHEDDPVRIAYDGFREQFGRDERILLAIEPPNVFDLAFLAKLRRLHREIEAEVPLLQDVQSLVNARNTRGEDDRLIVEDLLEDWPSGPVELAALRERVLGNPLYLDNLISADGRITILSIETDTYSSLAAGSDADLGGFDETADVDAAGSNDSHPPTYLTGEEDAVIVHALETVIERYRAPDFPIALAGTPVMNLHLQEEMLKGMRTFTGVALLVIAGLLALLFRRVAGVVVPLVIAGASLVCTMSAMGLAGVRITPPTQIVPSFLLAVGVGGSVHLLTIFYQARRRGESKEDAVAYSLQHSGLAIVMTSLTTAGGLLSFSVADLAPIAQFGGAAAAGTMISLLLTLTAVPAMISKLPMRSAAGTEGFGTVASRRVLEACGDFAGRRAFAIVLVCAGLIVAALLGIAQIRFSHEPMAWFQEDDPIRVANDLMNDRMKGAMFLEVLVDTGHENGLHDPAVLNALEEMRVTASRLQRKDVYVGKTVSLADVVKETHQALNENRPEYYTIPQHQRLVAQELLLFENSGSDDLEDLVDSRFQIARMTLKLPFLDAIQYDGFMTLLDEEFEAILGGRAQFQLTGLMAMLGRTFQSVYFSMINSYLLAVCVITPMMVLLIGRLGIGLLAMIPNLTPIILTLGFMGWADVPLDLFTLLIGCIALGLAVDDTIHFMHNFRRYYDQSGDTAFAIRETLTTTGQALLFTSLVLTSGFLVFSFSSMGNLVSFGLLTGSTIMLAFLSDIILAPALITLVTARQPDSTHLRRRQT